MRDIKKWDVEDPQFWESEGEKVANRNLWISILSLLCGFAVWMYWGIITIQMLNLGFPFTNSELFTLTAIAGLSGATLRIPSSFFIGICGGRNTIVFTTALLIIPAVGTGIALQDKNTPLLVFQILALLSGIGGGNFASSMSNISFFFPKKHQGLALGLNAGLGNFGVTTMQILVPLAMTYGVFGGEPMELVNASGTLIGKIPAGSDAWIHNAAYVWLLFLVPLVLVGWWGMNNIITPQVTPDLPSPVISFSIISGMLLIGILAAVFGIWLMMPERFGGSGLDVSMWIVLPMIVAMTVFMLRLIPGKVKENLTRQYEIFGNKHTWVMSIIYTMTFGSFIGFAAGLGLSIKVIFGFQHLMIDGIMNHDTVNPNGPSALMYAWMGPFIGALIRPVGGWLADKFGGALVTQICAITMVPSAIGVAYYMQVAYASATPEEFFVPFLVLFLAIFAASGIGNGSAARTISMIFNKEQAGPALGWTSAIAAYGAFIIPLVLGEQFRLTTPENAIYGFAIFYAVCIVINWWFYLRKGAEFHNP